MVQNNLVARSKLAPPRLHKHTLTRPRLTQRLLEVVDYRLAVLQAGAGYGKSTALAALDGEKYPLVWYRLDAEDADPLLFVHHLLQGFAAVLPDFSDMLLAMLDKGERSGGSQSWIVSIDTLFNELVQRDDRPLLLILDDVHHLTDTAETIQILDRFTSRAPQNLHLILSTRYPFKMPSLVTWRVKGQVLEIGQEELAFTAKEIDALFQEQYGMVLTLNQVQELAARTEGWAMALQLVRQRLQRSNGNSMTQALGHLSGSTGDFFDYLAREVLQQQPPDIQEFLRQTAVLRGMTSQLCGLFRIANNSKEILQYLTEQGLFVVDLGDDHFRYHHLFGDLLRQQLTPQAAEKAHLRAAACYQQLGQYEEAIYHLLDVVAFEEAAVVVERIGSEMVRAGRLDTLAGWIDDLPPHVLEGFPSLLAYLGDIARLHSRFDEALGWYRQAEQRSRARGDLQRTGQALRGQARVYLDTVNPSQAERLLQEALRLSDGQEGRESRARLLELMAENLLNRGRLEEAQQVQFQARELREEGPGEAELAVRVLLRTGRLNQARQLLERQVSIERDEPVLRPRAHRETLLLLSLIHAFQGEQEAAYDTAVEGTERGKALDSPFVTAVGYMRQGHAWALRKDARGYEEATRNFHKAVTLSDSLEVPRLKVEANWGLCQAYGFGGDVTAAEDAAKQGITLAQSDGDAWVEACIRTSMAGGYALATQYDQATTWLAQAVTTFRECGDTYGEAAARLWQCLIWQQTGDNARLVRDVESPLQLIREHGYDFLFLRQTLFGPPDPRALVPLLLQARQSEKQAPYVERLLRQMGLAGLQIHPGYQLRVQMLGSFRLWRGQEEVPAAAWKRKKARQLFQLLLTFREVMLPRDQITEMLWPELDPEDAQRDFKIAYNALCRVLEPERKRNASSAYIARDGKRYGLRPGVDLWLDVDQFEQLISQGNSLLEHNPKAGLLSFRHALAHYQGDFLQEYPYDDWCSAEREKLLTQYLHTAERLANLLAEQSAWEEVIEVCQLILGRDNCWEQAYRLMMRAYHKLGNRAQALRTYQRCVTSLNEELAVEPTAMTFGIYQDLL